MAHFYRYSSGGRRRRLLVQSYDLQQAKNTIAAMPQATSQQAEALDGTKASLERIKKQLATSGRVLLQGFLLKRSETLRKWNQRWFTLDPTSGKLEYRIERGDIKPKGLINLDAGSSIIVSPINLQGSIKYDGCCMYIQTSTKKEYFLCAETPAAAQAWVSTLRAAQLVLKAHRDAVSSLSGNPSSALGTVAAVVAAANATAKEAAKELVAASKSPTEGSSNSSSSEGNDGIMDNLTIMKETLKVKDDELHQMAKDMRTRDATIKELARKLSETAEAAEAAASAAHIMDNERKAARAEIVKLQKELDEKLQLSFHELTAMKDKLSAVEKARDDALKEALLWQGELAKAREDAMRKEAAMARAQETVRQASTGERVKNCITRSKNAGEREGEAVGPFRKHVSFSEDMKFEAPVVPALSTDQGMSEQVSGVTLNSMDNGIEDLLLDLEFVERKASFEKEKAADISAFNTNALDGLTERVDATSDDDVPQVHL